MDAEDRAVISGPIVDAGVTDMRIAGPLNIALVNNMSTAWAKTERKFRRIIAAGSIGRDVTLHCFRGAANGPAHYLNLDALFDLEPDGIVATGAEPQSKNLSDEPIFQTVARLARWAEARETPVLWSCLAAHAAVLHLDGIDRQPLEQKLCGVFHTNVLAADHPLLKGVASSFHAPHSRWNGLSQGALDKAGYNILTQAEEAGVDLFEKKNKTTFTFFQSHPEYEADTLLREFRRDFRRYQLG